MSNYPKGPFRKSVESPAEHDTGQKMLSTNEDEKNGNCPGENWRVNQKQPRIVYPTRIGVPTPSELTILSCPPSPKARSRTKDGPTLFCFDNFDSDVSPKDVKKNDKSFSRQQRQRQKSSPQVYLRRSRQRHSSFIPSTTTTTKAKRQLKSAVKMSLQFPLVSDCEDQMSSFKTPSSCRCPEGKSKTCDCAFELRKKPIIESITDFIQMEKLTQSLTKNTTSSASQKSRAVEVKTEGQNQNPISEQLDHCKQCQFYNELFKTAESRRQQLEKLKHFCHREIKTLKEDLIRAKNLISEQSIKLEKLAPSEGPPWIAPSDENTINPNVDYFSCRTFDPPSPQQTTKLSQTNPADNPQKKVPVQPSRPTATKKVGKDPNSNRVGFRVAESPKTLNRVDPKTTYKSIYSQQLRSKSVPNKNLQNELKKTYVDIHKRKVRTDSQKEVIFEPPTTATPGVSQPIINPRNHSHVNGPTTVKTRIPNYQTRRTKVIKVRSQSLPRNSKINIECPKNIDSRMVTGGRSNIEILAIAIASREGLIREIAHSIRKAKRILHFRFDMLISSDFSLDDFHFLLTSHRRFIRWLHNYVNYSRALMSRFDEQHLKTYNKKFFFPAIVQLNDSAICKGIFIPLPQSKIDQNYVEPQQSLPITFLQCQKYKKGTVKIPPPSNLHPVSTQTREFRLNLEISSITTQTPRRQSKDFEQYFNSDIQKADPATPILDDNNNNPQEFSFTSTRIVSKLGQDKETCTKVDQFETKIDTGCGPRSSDQLSFKRNVALQYIGSRSDIQEKNEDKKVSVDEAWSGHPTHHYSPVNYTILNMNIATKNSSSQLKTLNCAANFQTTTMMTEIGDSMDSLILKNSRNSVPASTSIQMEELWMTENRAPKINSSILSHDLNVPQDFNRNDDHSPNQNKSVTINQPAANHDQIVVPNSVQNEKCDNLHCYRPEGLDFDCKTDENMTSGGHLQLRPKFSNSEENLRVKRMSTGRFSPLDLVQEAHIQKEAQKFYNHRGNSQMRFLEPEKFLPNETTSITTDHPSCSSRSRKKMTRVTRSKSPLKLPTQTDYSCMEKYFEDNVKKYKEYLANPDEGQLPSFPSGAQVIRNILSDTCKEKPEGSPTANDGRSNKKLDDHHGDDDLNKFISKTKNLLKEQISGIYSSVYQPLIDSTPGLTLPNFSQFLGGDDHERGFTVDHLKSRRSRPEFIFQDHKKSGQLKQGTTQYRALTQTKQRPSPEDEIQFMIEQPVSPSVTPGISEVQIPPVLKSMRENSMPAQLGKLSVKGKRRSFIPVKTKTIVTKREETTNVLAQTPVKRLERMTGRFQEKQRQT